jgi:hypothetical protein
MDNLEPQQPVERELELLPVNFMLTLLVTDAEFKAHCKKCTHSCDVYPELCKQKLQIAKVWHKAQLAHDKATMVKLPSEDEMVRILTTMGLRGPKPLERAHELLRLLGGKP